MKLRRLVVLWVLTGCFLEVCQLSAQNTLKMTIDDLFARIEQSNIEVKAARKGVEISRQLEKEAKAKRLPDIGVDLGVNYLGDGIVLDRNFTNPTRSPMPHLGNSLLLSLYQPLYAGGEITADIQKSKYQTQIASTDLNIVTDKMKMEVLDCFLNLLKYKNLLTVYDENIRLTEQLLSEMNARVQQGLVLGNDVTRYELKLSNLNYDRTTVVNAIEHLNYSLLVYLGLDEGTVIEPDVNTENAELPDAGLEHWKKTTNDNSLELKRLDLAYQQAKVEEKLVRSSQLPDIGLEAANNLEAPITNTLPILDNNLNSWWVGFKLSFDLSSLYKNRNSLKAAKLETARIVDNRQAQAEAIDRQLDQVYKSFVESCEQVETQKKNVELASENYRIVKYRYSADLSLLTDMLDASTSKLDAEVRLVNAQVNVMLNYYQLKYISGIF